jgi:hypothetical protein
VETHWSFWLISNDMTPYGHHEASQTNRPRGLLFEHEDPHIRIWGRTWGQIIEECKQRLQFVQEALVYTSTRDTAIDYLRAQHERLLPPSLLDGDADANT